MTVSRLRVEDRPLVTGAGRYVADLCDADTLRAWFVRSPVAHGTITEIDLDMVRDAPGVVAVFTADDLDLRAIPGNTGRGPAAEGMARPPLAADTVRYVGEPVAVVVGTSSAAAEDAAALAWVEVDELPVVNTIEAALAGDTVLHPAEGTNVVTHTTSEHGPEPAAPFAVSATVDVESGRLAPVPIEALAILARPVDGGLHVWCGHQAPHRLRNQLSGMLDLERDAVRVTVPDVGGAFGMKGMLFPEYLVVAEVARRLGRPVAWIQPRREHFSGGTHGRGQHHRITLEGDADGRIRRARIEIRAETGAYPHNGSAVPGFSRYVATGLYDIERVELDLTIVVTNRAPTGSYRGAGRPEAALAIERAVDAFARAAGLDPFEVRLRNYVPSDALPYRTATGALYDSGDYAAALRRAMELLDLDALRAEQAERLRSGGPLLGVGVGSFIERAGGAVDSWEYGRVEIDPVRRKVIVRTGSTDTGQGHATVWRRLAAERFGIDDVEVHAKDTAEVADGIGSFASRSAQIGASAVVRTADRVLDAARRRAADRLEAAVEDIEYEAGVFRVAGSPGSELTIWELAAESELADEEKFSPHAQTFPYGAHAAVVEVLPETGEVRVRKIVAVDDCGVVLDPMIVEGQLHGSLVQGLGQALYERIVYDDAGQPVTSSLMDYSMPAAGDIPPIVSDRLVHPAPSNPLGVKGAGEAGCIGLPPAILNATLDALAPLGVTDLDLPLRPVSVWQAIRDAEETRNG